MILARKKTTQVKEHNYGKYFLASEAPGDDEEVADSPDRVNMKVVSARPDNRSRSDFSAVGDEPEEEELPEVEPPEETVPAGGGGDATPAQDEPDTDTTDYTQTPDAPATPDTQGEPASAAPETEPEPEGDATDYTQTADVPAAPEEVPEDTGDAGGEVPAAPDTEPEPDTDDGAEDFTQVDATPGDDGGGNAGGNAEQGDDNNDANNNARPGIDFDSMRKYNLYKEYARLRNTIETYIEKLESCMSDDYESNQIIKTATEKFREIHELVTDYMLLKFEACNYVQNLLFYQQQVATIDLVFKLLKTANGLHEKDEKKRDSKK